MGRDPLRPGAHTRGWNEKSLGVCFVGNYDERPVPEKMLERGAVLLRHLCRAYGLPPSLIRPHSEFSQKSCPGRLFDLGGLRDRVHHLLQVL